MIHGVSAHTAMLFIIKLSIWILAPWGTLLLEQRGRSQVWLAEMFRLLALADARGASRMLPTSHSSHVREAINGGRWAGALGKCADLTFETWVYLEMHEIWEPGL